MTKSRLLMLAVVLVIVAIVKKGMSQRQAAWQGLTESEVRSKLDAKLPGRIPSDKRSEISDKIVATMRDRGVISDEAADAPEEPESTPSVDLRESADDDTTQLVQD